jgi:hypothetical protein
MKVKEKTIKKLLAVLAVGTLFLSTLTPALASTAAEISGNGAQSENEVEVETEQEQVVVQQNTAVVKNHIEAEVSSGDNEASDNTNGEVAIHTGPATANTNINNKVNASVALIEDCPGCNEDIGAKISGNGAESENEIDIDSETQTEIFQENKAEIDNCVDTDVESGDNEAENNTGGDVTITTGPATANTNVNNLANANWAAIVSSFSSGPAWKGAEISGNGAKSENEIEIEQKRFITIVQDNWAEIFNRVEAEVSSGDNEASDNTNGDVVIHTGPATANINLNNKANFNFAEVECCLFDKTAKVSGNGAESENEVEFEHEDKLWVFQNGEKEDNQETDTDEWPRLSFDNWVEAEPESGNNEAEQNTGPEGDDPTVVTTSAATANVNVNNEGGLNVFVRGEFPCFPQTPELWFDFDLGEVFSLFW